MFNFLKKKQKKEKVHGKKIILRLLKTGPSSTVHPDGPDEIFKRAWLIEEKRIDNVKLINVLFWWYDFEQNSWFRTDEVEYYFVDWSISKDYIEVEVV
jgi:hypothetical protein